MASYQALFAIGESFEAFIHRGLPDEIAAVERVQQLLSASDAFDTTTLQRLHAVTGRYHLLVAAEMWCPDCQLNVAAMHRMQALQPRIDLSIITKGRVEDELLDRLELERILIPVVAVLDEGFELIGRFIERPQAVIDGGEAVRPDYRAGRYLQSTLTDLLAIIEAHEKHARG